MNNKYTVVLGVLVFAIIGTGTAIACLKPPVDECTQDCISPVPSIEVSVEPSTEPSVEPTIAVVITATAEATVAAPHVDVSDGRSDGKSDGLCSKPPCVSGNVVLPQSPPNTGQGF